MTDASRAVVWRAWYEPFGAVHAVAGPASLDLRLPGQWYQLESGLAYNWHRHYDASLGRYTQPDPLGTPSVLAAALAPADNIGLVGMTRAVSRVSLPWLGAGEGATVPLAGFGAHVSMTEREGTSLYGYAGQSSLMYTDPNGLTAGLAARSVSAVCRQFPTACASIVATAVKICEPVILAMGRKSDKEASTDVPSWAKGQKPLSGENGKDFADRLMDGRYGPGNWKGGANSEHNKLKKYGERHRRWEQ